MDYSEIKTQFCNGDWVVGVGKMEMEPPQGCSQVFDCDTDHPQPFAYLSSNEPDQFRLATPDEISAAKEYLNSDNF